jgi:hypothetical protein
MRGGAHGAPVPDCLGDGRYRFIDAGRGRRGQQRNHLCLASFHLD